MKTAKLLFFPFLFIGTAMIIHNLYAAVKLLLEIFNKNPKEFPFLFICIFAGLFTWAIYNHLKETGKID